MEKKAGEIQKERIKQIETAADELVGRCDVMFVSSVNENGYPRTCCMGKLKDEGFRDIYFVTSKRSAKQGKATHFETNCRSSVCFRDGGDSLTLVGNAEFVTDREGMQLLWKEEDRAFFPKGLEDPQIRFVHFHTTEATFWIGRKFMTVRYK